MRASILKSEVAGLIAIARRHCRNELVNGLSEILDRIDQDEQHEAIRCKSLEFVSLTAVTMDMAGRDLWFNEMPSKFGH